MKKVSALLTVVVSSMIALPTYARGGGGFGGFHGGGFGGGSGGFRSFGGGGFHGFGGGGGFHGFDGGRSDLGGFRNTAGGGFDHLAGGGSWSGDRGFTNRPDWGGFSGRTDGGNWHSPTDGPFGGLSGFKNHFPSGPSTHPIHNWNQNNQNRNIRNSFNQYNQYNFNHWGPYGHWGAWGGWWGPHGAWWGYPGAWYCPGWAAATAWTSLGFASMAAFLGLASASKPASYDYGNNIVYQGDTVYIDGAPAASAADYYQQSSTLAEAGNEQAAPASDQDQWQPLGVFSLAQEGQTQSTMLFQLAINQNGIVRGNYFNQLTNETAEVYGSLDKKTQRISWTIGQNNSTVFDTSLGNLCNEESAPVLVHYGPNSTQQMALVRLQYPPGGTPGQTPAAS